MRLIIALILALFSSAALGQGAGVVQQCFNPTGTGANQWINCPIGPGVTTNASSTITSGGTYQSVFAASTSRKACTVQNNGTHTMWVFFGAIGSATHGTSVVLAAGQSVQCASGNTVLADQVSIDGTTADAFYAGSQ